MVKKIPTRKTERDRHKNFQKVSNDFYEGAKAAIEFEYYNAAGVLIIHSAIALSDAISIKLAGEKCSGKSHYDVISLLGNIIPQTKERDSALKKLQSIIDHKNYVSYSGEIYYKKDVDKLFRSLERFRNWAEEVLT